MVFVLWADGPPDTKVLPTVHLTSQDAISIAVSFVEDFSSRYRAEVVGVSSARKHKLP